MTPRRDSKRVMVRSGRSARSARIALMAEEFPGTNTVYPAMTMNCGAAWRRQHRRLRKAAGTAGGAWELDKHCSPPRACSSAGRILGVQREGRDVGVLGPVAAGDSLRQTMPPSCPAGYVVFGS